MPYRSLLDRGVVTREMLQPDLRNSFASSSSVASAGSIASISLELAEAVVAGDAIAVNLSGLAVKATLSKPAIGITTTSGASGEMVEVIQSGTIASDRYSFTSGQTLWLATGTVNISATKPATSNGNYAQALGIALSDTKIIVDVNQAVKMIV